MRKLIYIFIALANSTNYANASWYENCELEASVVSEITEDSENRIFEIKVLASKSLKGSYTNCRSYINEVIEVAITHKEAKRYKLLAKGETIKIVRTAYDAFSQRGFDKHIVEFRSSQ